MAATARREIDTGEEDIAAIAKQISDHAEAIYQTWKARGLAPTEILSCRPTPGIKLTESLRTKPKPEPKPEIKQRPELRHHRIEVVREQRPEARREQRLECTEPDGEQMDVSLPPDLVPERNGTGASGPGARRADPAAMRLEVAREEERLLRALRTGGVVAERSMDRPDVVPPISLVDYAKSRYQDRLDTGASRKPGAGPSGDRRASLGSHVTEARSKFEARARRASSAGAVVGATGEAAAAAGTTPVRPFLTRGSVAERVLMFEKCPSEATLELAKRKSPAATTWRGPHDVINRAQNYAASTPPKPSSAPPHTTLQRSVRSAASTGAPARVIPRFHFPKGRPPPAHQLDHAVHKVQSAFATFPNSQVPRESFKHIVKACECPLYWKMPLFLATQQSLHVPVDGHKFINFWREVTSQCHDQASRFVYVLTRGKSDTLAPEDFVPLVQDVVDTHPGLSFLKEATEFHSRYVHTVIARIFYCVNRSWSGRISIPELRRSNLLQVIQLLEDEEDINQVTQFFSYEHFYVIYCKFWELDRDHDLFIDRHDLARHNDHALSSRMIERVLSGCVTRGNQNRLTPDGEPRMSYTEFVWFLLAEEDKTHPTAIEYWFRCMDVDGDGYISMYELEYFYEEQMQRMEAIGIETLPFNDCLCQMLDMVHPAEQGKITLTDLKRCKLTPIFYDTFFNLEKYLDHEQRDPFATQRDSDCEMSEWDRFAAEEYELLVAEEGGSDAQDQMEEDRSGYARVPRESFKHIVKACECPLYWKMPLFLATQQSLHVPVDGHKFINFWREVTSQCHDQASRFVYVLTRGKSDTLAPEDFVPLVQDVVDTHPGLSFLKEATEFHSRYVHTVIARIFYCVNRSWSGRISIPELRRSNLLQVIQLLEDEEDINQVTQFFSYEHFYVIYCKFWELDRDHDLFIDRHDLARHNDHALSSRMIERVLSGCVTRGNQNRLTPDGEPRMSYTEFVWFLLAEEDKTHPTAIEYWFRCMDVDGDGYISMYELEYFYEEQMQRMEAIGIETLPFNDCLCQMLDMVHPAEQGKITLTDLKRCKLTPIFYDTFFNLEKYLDHEQRDPFATQRDSDCEMSEWDRFAAEEYELLVAEEGGSDAQDQISYDETDEDCLSPNMDEITSTEVIEDSSVEESTLSEGPPNRLREPLNNSVRTAGSPGYVNLSSIYSIGADRLTYQNPPNTEKKQEKPIPPEKPVSLMMVNGKMDNRYAGFGNNSFLYSQLLGSSGARKDPPSYTAATAALFEKAAEKNMSPTKTRSPVTSPVNGMNKISDNYERAIAERLSPQRETARLNRSSLFSKVNTGVVSGKVKKARQDDDDDDYARDSDECSI